MNKKILAFSFFAFSLLGIFSCNKDKNTPTEIPSISAENKTLKINTSESKVEWKGFKIFQSENTSHLGILKFSQGELSVQNGILQGGTFVVDMNTLESFDLSDTEMKNKLENHLKSKDFFETEKFPTATFKINKVTPSETGDYNTILEGDLTIKNITKPLIINANILANENSISIFSEPTEIDRQDFGVQFQSPIENGIIKNEVEIQVIIKADIQ